MRANITFQSVKVLVDGHDGQGRLIFVDDQLSAVIVRLDDEAHCPEHHGCWHLEAGFGPCAPRTPPPPFPTAEDAAVWVRQRLARVGA
jgi:hypothetical protein